MCVRVWRTPRFEDSSSWRTCEGSRCLTSSWRWRGTMRMLPKEMNLAITNTKVRQAKLLLRERCDDNNPHRIAGYCSAYINWIKSHRKQSMQCWEKLCNDAELRKVVQWRRAERSGAMTIDSVSARLQNEIYISISNHVKMYLHIFIIKFWKWWAH